RFDYLDVEGIKEEALRVISDIFDGAKEIVSIEIDEFSSVSGTFLSEDLELYEFLIEEGQPVSISIARGLPPPDEAGFSSDLNLECEVEDLEYGYDSVSQEEPEYTKAAKLFLLKAFSEPLNGTKSVPAIRLKGENIEGVVVASDNRPYSIRVSKNGGYSYRLIDLEKKNLDSSSEKDDCKKGIPCGSSCVPRSFECEGILGAKASALSQLAFKTLEKAEIPSRKEILSAIAKEVVPSAKRLIKNPAEAIKEGNQREQSIRQLLEIASGESVPTRVELTKEGLAQVDKAIGEFKKEAKAFAEENEETVNSWIVNVGETGGGLLGGAIAGPVGAVGGAVTGTLATRMALSASKSSKTAKERLSDQEAFEAASRLKKTAMSTGETISDLKQRTNEISDNISEDISGYVIGTSVAAATSVIPGVSMIPFRGMIPAMIGSAGVSSAQAKLREGGTFKEAGGAAIEAMKQRVAPKDRGPIKVFTATFKKIVEEGNRRETEVRERINAKLRLAKQEGRI
ncbi:MAG TPA: hypothetical protein V6C65_23295, partial [Allocoleopsis sp.]